MTDESHSSARILDVRPIRVREELDRGRIVVLAGFQGVNPVTKEITTLGRGGSDTTAVAMAAALKAECCEIIKEVDGVCSADPRIVANSKPLRQLDFTSLSEMCFWGAKVLHFRSVELAQSQNVPLVLKKLGGAEHSTQVMREVMGMESGKVLAVNSMARIEHVEIDSADLNQGFEKFAQHLKQSGLSWPQLLASAFTAGKTRMMMTSDSESLDTLLRTLERSKDLRQQREALSSVSLTCFGGVSSDLPFKAIQILQQSRDYRRQICFVTAFGEFVCSCREPRGRGQGFAFADLVTVCPKYCGVLCEKLGVACPSVNWPGRKHAQFWDQSNLDRIREERVTPLVQGPHEVNIGYGLLDLCDRSIFVRRYQTESGACSIRRSLPNARPTTTYHSVGNKDRSPRALCRPALAHGVFAKMTSNRFRHNIRTSGLCSGPKKRRKPNSSRLA